MYRPAVRNRVTKEKKIYARDLRKNPTLAESLLWEKLRKKKLGVRFKRQVIFLGYIVDFYCAEVRLIVELDGDVHLERKDYDERRDNHLRNKNLHILRFKNDEVINDLDYVALVIEATIDGLK